MKILKCQPAAASSMWGMHRGDFWENSTTQYTQYPSISRYAYIYICSYKSVYILFVYTSAPAVCATGAAQMTESRHTGHVDLRSEDEELIHELRAFGLDEEAEVFYIYIYMYIYIYTRMNVYIQHYLNIGQVRVCVYICTYVLRLIYKFLMKYIYTYILYIYRTYECLYTTMFKHRTGACVCVYLYICFATDLYIFDEVYIYIYIIYISHVWMYIYNNV